eukprot:GHVL01029422.1.p1 GENE.GHVL01029422.1~~GHVL01029422.1.p1  ORF type:complete len:749 (+),score=141.80 GHVL01029422.1:39-2249(+)
MQKLSKLRVISQFSKISKNHTLSDTRSTASFCTISTEATPDNEALTADFKQRLDYLSSLVSCEALTPSDEFITWANETGVYVSEYGKLEDLSLFLWAFCALKYRYPMICISKSVFDRFQKLDESNMVDSANLTTVTYAMHYMGRAHLYNPELIQIVSKYINEFDNISALCLFLLESCRCHKYDIIRYIIEENNFINSKLNINSFKDIINNICVEDLCLIIHSLSKSPKILYNIIDNIYDYIINNNNNIINEISIRDLVLLYDTARWISNDRNPQTLRLIVGDKLMEYLPNMTTQEKISVIKVLSNVGSYTGKVAPDDVQRMAEAVFDMITNKEIMLLSHAQLSDVLSCVANVKCKNVNLSEIFSSEIKSRLSCIFDPNAGFGSLHLWRAYLECFCALKIKDDQLTSMAFKFVMSDHYLKTADMPLIAAFFMYFHEAHIGNTEIWDRLSDRAAEYFKFIKINSRVTLSWVVAAMWTTCSANCVSSRLAQMTFKKISSLVENHPDFLHQTNIALHQLSWCFMYAGLHKNETYLKLADMVFGTECRLNPVKRYEVAQAILNETIPAVKPSAQAEFVKKHAEEAMKTAEHDLHCGFKGRPKILDEFFYVLSKFNIPHEVGGYAGPWKVDVVLKNEDKKCIIFVDKYRDMKNFNEKVHRPGGQLLTSIKSIKEHGWSPILIHESKWDRYTNTQESYVLSCLTEAGVKVNEEREHSPSSSSSNAETEKKDGFSGGMYESNPW